MKEKLRIVYPEIHPDPCGHDCRACRRTTNRVLFGAAALMAVLVGLVIVLGGK